jgi:hypothetical protein
VCDNYCEGVTREEKEEEDLDLEAPIAISTSLFPKELETRECL